MTERAKRILVFSHRAEVRDSIINAVGRRPAVDLGKVTYVEAEGVAEVLTEMDSGEIDLAILDGEAQPTGGIGRSEERRVGKECGARWIQEHESTYTC